MGKWSVRQTAHSRPNSGLARRRCRRASTPRCCAVADEHGIPATSMGFSIPRASLRCSHIQTANRRRPRYSSHPTSIPHQGLSRLSSIWGTSLPALCIQSRQRDAAGYARGGARIEPNLACDLCDLAGWWVYGGGDRTSSSKLITCGRGRTRY